VKIRATPAGKRLKALVEVPSNMIGEFTQGASELATVCRDIVVDILLNPPDEIGTKAIEGCAFRGLPRVVESFAVGPQCHGKMNEGGRGFNAFHFAPALIYCRHDRSLAREACKDHERPVLSPDVEGTRGVNAS